MSFPYGYYLEALYILPNEVEVKGPVYYLRFVPTFVTQHKNKWKYLSNAHKNLRGESSVLRISFRSCKINVFIITEFLKPDLTLLINSKAP